MDEDDIKDARQAPAGTPPAGPEAARARSPIPSQRLALGALANPEADDQEAPADGETSAAVMHGMVACDSR